MDIQMVLEAIKALGIAGGPVFAFLWKLERDERKACQQETRGLLVNSLTLTSQVATSISDVTKAVAVLGDGDRETTAMLAQLAQLVRSLGAAIRKRAGE